MTCVSCMPVRQTGAVHKNRTFSNFCSNAHNALCTQCTQWSLQGSFTWRAFHACGCGRQVQCIKIELFLIFAAMHTSAAPACIKRTLCESAFSVFVMVLKEKETLQDYYNSINALAWNVLERFIGWKLIDQLKLLIRKPDLAWQTKPVWPDLAKFCHFDKS